MARIAIIALSVAVTLTVPAILAVNGIVSTNDRYVEAVYDYGGVPTTATDLRPPTANVWRCGPALDRALVGRGDRTAAGGQASER